MEQNLFTAEDKKQLASKGISEQQVEHQLECFKTGFPFLKLEAAASIDNGILAPSSEEQEAYLKAWDTYKDEGKRIVKFVPASGAASRMFKNMFGFLTAEYDVPTTDFEKRFFSEIQRFAFYADLNAVCKKNTGKEIPELMEEGAYKEIVSNLLEKKGLNYGQLPKGVLEFHKYADGTVRTPAEEHLVESALYAASKGVVYVHFTVSPEHKDFFEHLVEEKKAKYADKYHTSFHISFSVQKPSTDTLAATMDNKPFRTEDGKLLFRPGGHGALIENLNDLDADVVFIKNIDNVVPDRLKDETVHYKKLLAGVLVTLQDRIFKYLRLLDSGIYSHAELEDIIRFLQQQLWCRKADIKHLEDAELVLYLKKKLNRPIRVCGMVKNVGEPGGGPFLAYNQDGTVSLQILESSQIDTKNPEYMEMFKNGTHFNPVDLVCGIKNYNGEKFNLPDFVDKKTGFISYKSKNGRDLKALELPGLWNGSMSNWNTIFVEVPLGTFNPVKTVNDLLREQHQE